MRSSTLLRKTRNNKIHHLDFFTSKKPMFNDFFHIISRFLYQPRIPKIVNLKEKKKETGNLQRTVHLVKA